MLEFNNFIGFFWSFFTIFNFIETIVVIDQYKFSEQQLLCFSEKSVEKSLQIETTRMIKYCMKEEHQ